MLGLSVASVFETRCNPQEAGLENAFIHSGAIINYDDFATFRVVKICTRNGDETRIGVIGVLDELEEGSRVAADK
jgi:hypothetical protein